MKPETSPRPPTMRQLAKWAGVSPAAVSLALRDHPSIPQPTRERIKQLAYEKGYCADPVVASLMARLRTSRGRREAEKIALLTFWFQARKESDDDYNYKGYRAGICERAKQLGYEVEEFWAKEPGISSSRLSKILYTRGIRGVILAPQWRPFGHASLDWQYFAVASISYTITKPDVHRVTHSHFNGMQSALRQLKRRGYRRPGFATMAGQNERVKRSWEGSFLAYQATLPAKSRIPPLLTSALTPKEFRQWLDKYRPDVVLSNLVSPLQMLASLGYSVPDEIGFASLDVAPTAVQRASSTSGASQPAAFEIIPKTSWRHDQVAGIDQQPFVQGAATADLVIKQVQNNEFGLPGHPITLHLDGVWRDGMTVRAPQG